MTNGETVFIKEAYKGRSAVIMDSVYYVHHDQIIHKQTEDKNTHKKVGSSFDNKRMRANNEPLKSIKTLFLNNKLIIWQTFNMKVVISMVFLKSTNLKYLRRNRRARFWIHFMFLTKRFKTTPFSSRSQMSDKRIRNFVDIPLKPLCPKLKVM